jgi:hypothetical protein
MTNVFEALETEWRRLRRDRAAAARLADVCQQAGGAGMLAEVEHYVRHATPPQADQVLLALAAHVVGTPATAGPAGTETGTGTGSDEPDRETVLLAARVMLQLLLPGTRKLARRWWALGDRDERAAAAITAVYHHIRNYPLQRRPGRVAANILMDASYDLRRTLPRVITVPVEDPAALHRRGTVGQAPGAAGDLNPGEELAQVLTDAVAEGTIDPADAQLIARTRIAGHTVDDIATERDRTPRTMWHRRKKAEATLATTTLRPC